MADNNNPSLRELKSPSPQHWDVLKPHVRRLYIQEDKTLKKTMAEIQISFGFQAR
jgi:Clr5 domain